MHTQLVKKLLLATVMMFAFGFALVPLYDVFCEVTGLNGKPSLEQAENSTSIDKAREVEVSFISHTQGQAPFEVKSADFLVHVSPGEVSKVHFKAKNLSERPRVMQAIPSVAPSAAAKYLHKMACFCFDQQPLDAYQEVEFTLVFYVDTELPDDIQELTLSYTLFDITDRTAMNTNDIDVQKTWVVAR